MFRTFEISSNFGLIAYDEVQRPILEAIGTECDFKLLTL